MAIDKKLKELTDLIDFQIDEFENLEQNIVIIAQKSELKGYVNKVKKEVGQKLCN